MAYYDEANYYDESDVPATQGRGTPQYDEPMGDDGGWGDYYRQWYGAGGQQQQQQGADQGYGGWGSQDEAMAYYDEQLRQIDEAYAQQTPSFGVSEPERSKYEGMIQPGGGGPASQGYDYYAGPTPYSGEMPSIGDYLEEDVALDLPEYEPPEEDPGVYRQAREAAYQRGTADLRLTVDQAIQGSASLDNPAAQQQFVRAALESMAKGAAQVGTQAAQEGRTEAARKRAEELKIYDAKYKAESEEAYAAYRASYDQAMAEWEAAMGQWAAGYGGGANQPWWQQDPWDAAGMSKEEYDKKYRK